MRVIALGAYFMKGTSGKTGKAYDMAKVVIRTPISNDATATMQKGGYGWETTELDLEPEALKKFAFDYGEAGIPLELEVGSTIMYGRLRAIVTGCKRAQ